MFRSKLKIAPMLFVLLGAILLLLSSANAVGARQPNDPDDVDDISALPLDHFWCYKTTSTPVNEVVGLQDQFHAQPIPVQVGAPRFLCNPAEKKHGNKVFEIKDPNAHLLMYQIGVAQQKTRRVEVKNQFGTRTLQVWEPATLQAVPTKKNDHPAPQGLDHFQCYRVKGAPVDAVVGLKDQFMQASNLNVVKPVLLCNPTRKVHGDKVFEVQHPKAHLVCYRITPTDFSRDVDTVNQFRAEKITVIDPNMLCAPSKKRELNN